MPLIGKRDSYFRIPVTIRKSVPGNVAERISAAVWREAIDLVLNGVIDVDDLDRAVSAIALPRR